MSKSTTFAKAQMVIRRPVREVFEAFVDPQITSKFWFTDSTGRLLIEWGNPGDTTLAELLFESTPDGSTFVRVAESGEVPDGEALLRKAIAQTGGWNLVLAALKAWLEHDIVLSVVADHHPGKEALVKDGIPITAFQVDAIQAEYQRLKERGVRFTQAPTKAESTVIAVFDDTCGKDMRRLTRCRFPSKENVRRMFAAHHLGRHQPQRVPIDAAE